jgi:hypothetical protein
MPPATLRSPHRPARRLDGWAGRGRVGEPWVELGWRVDDRLGDVVGVADSADLGADDGVFAWLLGGEPALRRVAGDGVDLDAEVGDEQRMNDIRRGDVQFDGSIASADEGHSGESERRDGLARTAFLPCGK